jgi:hemerythrin
MNQGTWQNDKFVPNATTYSNKIVIDPNQTPGVLTDENVTSHLTLITQLKENLAKYIKRRFDEERKYIKDLQEKVDTDRQGNQKTINEYKETVQRYDVMFQESKRLLEELDKAVAASAGQVQ